MKTRPKNMRQTGHYFTAARMVAAAAALAAGKDGNLMLQARLLGRVGTKDEQRTLNQRQRRKARRQRWAAGDRTAFAA